MPSHAPSSEVGRRQIAAAGDRQPAAQLLRYFAVKHRDLLVEPLLLLIGTDWDPGFDAPNNGIHVTLYVRRRDAHDGVSLGAHLLVSATVFCFASDVASPIDLDDESRSRNLDVDGPAKVLACGSIDNMSRRRRAPVGSSSVGVGFARISSAAIAPQDGSRSAGCRTAAAFRRSKQARTPAALVLSPPQ